MFYLTAFSTTLSGNTFLSSSIPHFSSSLHFSKLTPHSLHSHGLIPTPVNYPLAHEIKMKSRSYLTHFEIKHSIVTLKDKYHRYRNFYVERTGSITQTRPYRR